jgi:NADH:ubiquinone oxidoreductase subunit 6 (subunit J)
MELIAFALLTILAIGSAVVVIAHRNPIVSALALAFNLVAIAGSTC